MPYLTWEQRTGSPPSHFTPGFSVKFQVVLLSLGRPVSVARSGTISDWCPGVDRYVVSVLVVSRRTFISVALYVRCGSSWPMPDWRFTNSVPPFCGSGGRLEASARLQALRAVTL